MSVEQMMRHSQRGGPTGNARRPIPAHDDLHLATLHRGQSGSHLQVPGNREQCYVSHDMRNQAVYSDTRARASLLWILLFLSVKYRAIQLGLMEAKVLTWTYHRLSI